MTNAPMGVADESAVVALRKNLRGDLLTPEHPDYDEGRKVWNGMIDRHPALIARVAGAAEVVACVNFAREHDVLLSVKGGAHNIPGNAVCDGGLVIDFSRMKAVDVDPEKRTARAEPGVKWGEFDRATQLHGLATTGGTFSDTGIAGLTLGGGVGWLGGKYGLASDNVISFEVVTANGRLQTASETENEDLFWALRGGGGNFGVVTTFTYRLHEVGTLLAGLVLHPFERAREVLRFYRGFVTGTPDELVTGCGLLTGPDGHKGVGIIVCYNGDHAEGEKVLKPVREFGPPIMDQIGAMPYEALQNMTEAMAPPGRNYYVKAPWMNAIEDGVIDVLVDRFTEVPSPYTIMLFQQKAGAMSSGRPDQTAFGHRSDRFMFAAISGWEDPSEAEANIVWTRRLAAELEPYSSGGEYVNELGPADSPTHIRASFGSNFDRLRELKKKYDPSNLFRHTQNITPSE